MAGACLQGMWYLNRRRHNVGSGEGELCPGVCLQDCRLRWLWLGGSSLGWMLVAGRPCLCSRCMPLLYDKSAGRLTCSATCLITAYLCTVCNAACPAGCPK